VSAHARAQCLGSLRVELEDTNGQDDLQLGSVGNAIPKRRRADALRAEDPLRKRSSEPNDSPDDRSQLDLRNPRVIWFKTTQARTTQSALTIR
jgi:hypothetical protein